MLVFGSLYVLLKSFRVLIHKLLKSLAGIQKLRYPCFEILPLVAPHFVNRIYIFDKCYHTPNH